MGKPFKNPMLSADQLKEKEKEKEAKKEATGAPDAYVEKLNLPAELAKLQDIRKIRLTALKMEYQEARKEAIATDEAWREERRKDVAAQNAMLWEVAGDLLRKLGHRDPAQDAQEQAVTAELQGEGEEAEAEDAESKHAQKAKAEEEKAAASSLPILLVCPSLSVLCGSRMQANAVTHQKPKTHVGGSMRGRTMKMQNEKFGGSLKPKKSKADLRRLSGLFQDQDSKDDEQA